MEANSPPMSRPGRVGSDEEMGSSRVPSSRIGKFGRTGDNEGKLGEIFLGIPYTSAAGRTSGWDRSVGMGGEELIFKGELGRAGGLQIFRRFGGGGGSGGCRMADLEESFSFFSLSALSRSASYPVASAVIGSFAEDALPCLDLDRGLPRNGEEGWPGKTGGGMELMTGV